MLPSNAAEHQLDRTIRAVLSGCLNRYPTPSIKLQNEILAFVVRNARHAPALSPDYALRLLKLAQVEPQQWPVLAEREFLATPRTMGLPPIPVRSPERRRREPREQKLRIVHGRFEACADVLLPESVDLVLTSPPYAMQRRESYGGISEHEYPAWTSRWMALVRRVLKPGGSVAIIIRPHVQQGRVASYVRHTLEWLEQDGWTYCDDLIWYKPDAPPLGHAKRPRRSWEAIHWLSRDPRPYCNPQAAGQFSKRLGLTGTKGLGAHVHNVSEAYREGVSRASDVIVAPIRSVDRSEFNTHPAQFPAPLAEKLIRMFCPRGGLVLDPFVGSGTTGVAALATGRRFVGFEQDGGYANIARKRLRLFRGEMRADLARRMLSEHTAS